MNTGPLYFIHVNLAAALLLALVVLVAGLTTAKNILVTKINIYWYSLSYNSLSSGCVE